MSLPFALAAFACSGDPGTTPSSGDGPPPEPQPTADTAPPGPTGDTAPDDTGPTPTGSTGDTGTDGVEALIGVGYGGLRVVSRDGGETWTDRAAFSAAGGDDEDLLRAVAYGDGLWIATGWKLVTSTDGVNWTDHGLLNGDPALPPCNIVEGLAWADGAFYAACADWTGTGNVYRSTDGAAWSFHASIGPTEGHLFLAWNDGTFAAYGDTGTSFVSTDAVTWTELPGVVRATWCDGAWQSADACHGASWFDGAWFRTGWPDRIERSTTGVDWTLVYTDPEENSLYQPRAIARGRVSP